MATQRQLILGWATGPSSNINNPFFESARVKATNAVWGRLVGIFNDTTTRDGIEGSFTVPKLYVDTPKVIIVWTSIAIVGNVAFDFDYRAVGGNDLESLDQAGVQESVADLPVAPSTANNRMETSIPLTGTNFSPDDTTDFTVFRDGTDAGDTLAAAVRLYDLFFEYEDA